MLTWSTLALLGSAWAAPPTAQVEQADWTQDLKLVALSSERSTAVKSKENSFCS